MNSSILPFTKSITTHIFTSQKHHHHHLHRQPPTLLPIRTSSSDNTTATTTDDNPSPPSDKNAVQIKFRRGVRRKTRRDQENESNDKNMMMGRKKEVAKKEWEDMTVREKALELYVGEKGLLFWINKFAYASIYIIIGAWILFRFVGPALNLYQLDAPPLSPTDVLKGSPK
ncbi:uncharacterized protein LOC112513408 [Cynara cardunculus var. scolymus]|uniref:Transmembrane protein n=1 Tax=Cynara cardunculus var. scolymus TaxID=59895 RepID=A0A118K1I5_CYNCS|nr:uncharacterized protein LOC112513408 [Cynara cardunculus var. scolymus]KVI02938.1 hypothetical protein Ccrd_018768 [Cynara cardunculus var. scolymus]